MSLASGVAGTFADPDLPDFVPSVSSVLNILGTNPDFIYAYTRIDGTGSYRLSGERGDGLFLLFDFAAGGLGVNDKLGPSVGTLDIDACTITDGCFDVLLSAERPIGHGGDWFHLDPRARPPWSARPHMIGVPGARRESRSSGSIVQSSRGPSLRPRLRGGSSCSPPIRCASPVLPWIMAKDSATAVSSTSWSMTTGLGAAGWRASTIIKAFSE